VKALKIIGADLLAAASVLAACWAAFATGRLILVGLGIRTPPPIHQEVFQDIVAGGRGAGRRGRRPAFQTRWLQHPND